MNIKELLETIKDTSRDYVGIDGCLYQDITREELDLIVNEIERLNKENNNLKEDYKRHIDRINELPNIIDKAIEILEIEKKSQELINNGFCACSICNALDILKGSDKE